MSVPVACATPGTAKEISAALQREGSVYTVHSSNREMDFRNANDLIFCIGVNFTLAGYAAYLRPTTMSSSLHESSSPRAL